MPAARGDDVDDAVETITRKVRIHVAGMATGTLCAISRARPEISPLRRMQRV